jgi:nudix-type nucleoside diphosphatase (YffH/AdpP family)
MGEAVATQGAALQPLMILVAGPFRSGTADDPARIGENLAALRSATLALFRAGHLAVNGEDIALPLAEVAGSSRVGDQAFDEVFHPVARRLVARCDAVLRLPGDSAGSDEMVEIARARGLPVYTDVGDVPAPLPGADRPGIDIPDARGRTGLDQTGRDLFANPRVRVKDVELTAAGWHVLRRTTFDFQHRDGHWSTESRETYDRGNGATILLHDTERRTVLLSRQFRYPVYVNGHPDGMFIEAPAGLLDEDDPETAVRRETFEEVGVDVDELMHVFDSFMSPGSVTERLHFYAASYSATNRTGPGGGLAEDGEDIEVVELLFDDALAMTLDGRISDAKTIMLLQWAALHGPFSHAQT